MADPVTIYALERILSHLSEDNYPHVELVTSYAGGRIVTVPSMTNDMHRALWQGRAAARVIIKRLLAQAKGDVSSLWAEEKGGE